MPFFLWGILLLGYRIAHYGISSGFFLWFDQWFLLLSGIALIKRLERAQVALTYPIFIVQALLVLDNLYFLLFGKTGLGATSFLFQPGISLIEFLLLQSHFIQTPFLLLLLPERQNKTALSLKLILFPALIFLMSYFTPVQNDINCIHSTCTSFHLPVPPWTSSLAFAILSCCFFYLFSEILRRIFCSTLLENHRKKIAKILIVTGMIAVIWNIQHFFASPRFTCASAETSDAKIECLYTTDYSSQYFLLHYSIFIKAKTRKECSPLLLMGDSKEAMEVPMLLPPGEKHPFSILVPFPKTSVEGKLQIECHDFKY